MAQGNLPEALKAYRDSLAIVTASPRPTPAMPDGSATSRSHTTRSATCWWPRATCPRRSKPTATASPSQTASPRPTPATPDGSATCRYHITRSATCWWPRAICPRRSKPTATRHDIFDRLAKADPGNAGWQRDLSVSYKVGDVLVAQGNLPEALKAYRDCLAIRDRLAKADPGNAGWQYDLGISNERIGDVLMAQGNLPEAMKSYQRSMGSSPGSPRPTPETPDGSAT